MSLNQVGSEVNQAEQLDNGNKLQEFYDLQDLGYEGRSTEETTRFFKLYRELVDAK